jgi:amino acid transporter
MFGSLALEIEPMTGEDERDSAQLKALGYSATFERSLSAWGNFSLGFTYLSPVVGVYTVFALALVAGGPPMFWSYLLVGIGVFLICLIFGEIVSQFPISGGLYPWTRRLVGRRWAWMSGWVYLCALCTSISAVAVGGAPYIAEILGFKESPAVDIATAIVMIAFTTALNVSGTGLLARVAIFGFVCEIIGAVAVGAYLLVFARHQPFSVLFNTYHLGVNGNYLPAFLASSVAAMFAYYGFEACGDVAEETPDPARTIPRTMQLTIYIGGSAAMLVCLALLLAVPDMGAAVSGKDADPIATALRAALGETGLRVVLAVVLVSFFSCLLSLQAATSRLLFAYARDGMIFASPLFSRVSSRSHVPVPALIFAGVVPVGISVVGLFLQDAVKAIVSFGSVGIYIAFQMVVLAALIARIRGWQPSGPFRLNAWAWPVNIGALAFGVGAVLNIIWPRSPDQPWYDNYGMLLATLGVFFTGLAYMLIARPYEHSDAPSGDAHRLHAAPRLDTREPITP